MFFLGWNRNAAARLRELGVREDLLGGLGHSSLSLVDEHPQELLVFGADLGHAHHPAPAPPAAMPTWLRDLEKRVGEKAAHRILSENGMALLLP